MEEKLRKELMRIGHEIKRLYMEDKERLPLNGDLIKELLIKRNKIINQLKEYGKDI